MRDATAQPVRRSWADAVLACCVFGSLLAVYVTTLLPGLGGTEDTPKFQYIGAVLGTAHEPGYPLYTLLTHAWSRLPLGTLAYRINLFSAVWGALACAFVFLALRRLLVYRRLAVATSCAMGLGRTFWQHSLFAEVYTLSAALTAAAILALLSWETSRRTGWLYAAAAAASLAFGTHLIIVGALPAIVWFAVATWRWRVPLRVAVVVALIVSAGVAQYGYVWLRTAQRAEYLEARADRLSDMWDVMRAARFPAFSDSPGALTTRRLPAVLQEVHMEVGAAGALLAAGGAVHLLRRRRRVGGLLVGAAAGQLALLAMLGDVAIGPIALPGVAVVWLLIGAGIEAARLALAARTPGWIATGVAGTVATGMALAGGSANFAFNDHRHDLFETGYFRLLFASLPERSAVVAEEYQVDHMVNYQRVVTRQTSIITAVPPDAEAVRRLHQNGVPVFAFSNGRTALGQHFVLRPVQLRGLALDERLQTLRRGLIVVAAGSTPAWGKMAALGVDSAATPRGRAVVVGVAGAGLAVRTPDGFQGEIAFARGDRLGDTGVVAPVSIRVVASEQRSEVFIDGERVASTASGIAVAEIGSRIDAAYVLTPENGMRAPVDMSRRPLFEVGGAFPRESCAAFGHGEWTALPGTRASSVLLGRVDNRAPAMARWEVYLASDDPLSVRLGDTFGVGTPQMTVEAFAANSPGIQPLLDRIAADGVTDTAWLAGARTVTRIRVEVNDQGESSAFTLNLGGIARGGIGRARLDAPASARAGVCAVPQETLAPGAQRAGAEVYLGSGGDRYFGSGWGRAASTSFGVERSLMSGSAELLLPLDSAEPVMLSMRIGGVDADGTAEVLVNGHALDTQAMRPGWNDLVWRAPQAVWKAGLNRVTLCTTSPAPPAVRSIRLLSDTR